MDSDELEATAPGGGKGGRGRFQRRGLQGEVNLWGSRDDWKHCACIDGGLECPVGCAARGFDSATRTTALVLLFRSNNGQCIHTSAEHTHVSGEFDQIRRCSAQLSSALQALGQSAVFRARFTLFVKVVQLRDKSALISRVLYTPLLVNV